MAVAYGTAGSIVDRLAATHILRCIRGLAGQHIRNGHYAQPPRARAAQRMLRQHGLRGVQQVPQELPLVGCLVPQVGTIPSVVSCASVTIWDTTDKRVERVMRAKAQHTVSQFYLRSFRSKAGQTPGDDYIWCYYKPTGICREQKISKVGFVSRFYDWTAPSGKVISVEDQVLGKLESMFKPALAAVLSDPCYDILMAYQSKIASFIACQSLRTSSFRKMQQEAYRALVGQGSASDNDQAANHIRFMLEYLQPVAGIFLQKRWILVHNETNTLLWTSNNPVAMHQRERDGRRHIGLVPTGVETSIPLSPRLSLILCDSSASVPDGVEIEARRSDVNFLNVHQIWSADRCLFSADGRFDMAKTIIAKLPEMADPNRALLE